MILHLILALAIVGLVLLQKSEGGGLGIGGGGGSMGGLTGAGGAANILTKATSIAAALFFVTSLTLAVLSGGTSSVDIFEELEREEMRGGVSVPASLDEDVAEPDPEPEGGFGSIQDNNNATQEPSVPIAE